MRQTWFQYHQERRAVTQRKQQGNLTPEQTERYAQEARGEIQDLVQVRRRERQREAENRGLFDVTEEEAMVDQTIKWPPGSDRHPFQRIADLSLKIAGRNPSLRYRLFRFFGEESAKGTSAAAIYEAVWETINHLAHDVLDEAIGVVYDAPIPAPAHEPAHEQIEETVQRARLEASMIIDEAKANSKAATAA